MDNMTANTIAKLLAQRAEAVARYLLPTGKKVGNEWRIGSLDGEAGQSLGIHLTGEKAGVFCDFATGEAGDLLTLWALKRNFSLAEAINEAKGWLGIASPRFVAYSPKPYQKPILTKTLTLQPLSLAYRYLTETRKLLPQTLEAFKIGESQQEMIFPYYRNDELIFIKYLHVERPHGKKQMRVETHCEPCLFGWQTIPPHAREVTLTEGEIDAMSLYQLGIPALSVPFGGGSGAKQQWLEHEYERLALFDQIYLCLDNDEQGQQAVNTLVDRLGRHRCLIVQLPHKDANACLQAGMTATEMQTYFQQAKSLDPLELKCASLFVQQVIEEFFPSETTVRGIRPPWEKAQDKILFRPDELSIWGGINGHGKSQFLGHVILSSLQQGAKVCIASLELKPKRLLMRLTRQAAGIAQPSEAYIQAIHAWYHGCLWLFDLVGNAKAERLLEVFRYAYQRYGIDTFVIDSLMKLDIAEDDYKAQKAFLEKLCDFKNEYNCHIHLVVHPRKGMDETRFPTKLDAKGTGAITDLADNCFTIWRNKAKEEELQKLKSQGQPPSEALLKQIDCLWICDKQRNGEWEGKIGLWFHRESYQYLNSLNQKPAQFVDYSTTSHF